MSNNFISRSILSINVELRFNSAGNLTYLLYMIGEFFFTSFLEDNPIKLRNELEIFLK